MTITKRQIFYLAIAGVTLAIFAFVAHEGGIAWRNHRVREWVESYGGVVDYYREDAQGNRIDGSRTPSVFRRFFDEPILDPITGIGIQGSPQISVEQVEMLAELRYLVSLGMGASSFSDDHASALAKAKSLTHLSLEETEITDQGLAIIAESLSELNSLDLVRNSGITGQGLGHLSKLPNLRKLWLNGSTFSDSDLKELRGLDTLTELCVGDQITDAGIVEIAQIKSLKTIGFYGSSVTDAGMDVLVANLPNLEKLVLRSPNVSDRKWQELQKSGILIWGHPDYP